jgi:hypothetical protein
MVIRKAYIFPVYDGCGYDSSMLKAGQYLRTHVVRAGWKGSGTSVPHKSPPTKKLNPPVSYWMINKATTRNG